ncbi:hypothetical protein BDF22DRAFT_740410 [Syncephalis plumigaleata]|nr:hypothetical protein BDF22DRAFT_740410 [Syncephalis plumigaleata]
MSSAKIASYAIGEQHSDNIATTSNYMSRKANVNIYNGSNVIDLEEEEHDSLGELPTPNAIHSVIRQQSSKKRRMPVPRRSMTTRSAENSFRSRYRGSGHAVLSAGSSPGVSGRKRSGIPNYSSRSSTSRTNVTRHSHDMGLAALELQSVVAPNTTRTNNGQSSRRHSKRQEHHGKLMDSAMQSKRSSKSLRRSEKSKGKQPEYAWKQSSDQTLNAYGLPTPASSPVSHKHGRRSNEVTFSQTSSDDNIINMSCLPWLANTKPSTSSAHTSILNEEFYKRSRVKVKTIRRRNWSLSRNLEGIYEYNSDVPRLTALTVGRECVERERYRASIKQDNPAAIISRARSNSFQSTNSTINMVDKARFLTEPSGNNQAKTLQSDDQNRNHPKANSNNNENKDQVDDYLALTPNEIGRLYAKITEDSASYRLLRLDEHGQLCRQIEDLENNVETLAYRLAVETRLRDGALTLYRLHSSNKKVAARIEDQYRVINRSMDQICLNLWRQTRRAWCARRSLLEHQVYVAVRVADELEAKSQLDKLNSTLLGKNNLIKELQQKLDDERKTKSASSESIVSTKTDQPSQHWNVLSLDEDTGSNTHGELTGLQKEVNETREREVHYVRIIQQQLQALHALRAKSSIYDSASQSSDSMMGDFDLTSKIPLETEQYIRGLEQQLHQANTETSHYQSCITKYETTISNLYAQLQATLTSTDPLFESLFPNVETQQEPNSYQVTNETKAFSRGIIELLDRYRRLAVYQQLVDQDRVDDIEEHAWSSSISGFPMPGAVITTRTTTISQAHARVGGVPYSHMMIPSPRTSEDDPKSSNHEVTNDERIRLLEDEIEVLRARDTQARMFIARLGRSDSFDWKAASTQNDDHSQQ